MKTNIPSHLSDTALEAEVKRLARCEREATVQLIAHLMEFDARLLHLGAGFSSLFAYCCEVLRLSEHEAYNRIEVARTARAFPLVLDLLAEGSLTQTTIRLLAPHLSSANHEELLTAASHRSKRDVEELVARRFPRPAVPASIRKLPDSKPAPILPSAAPVAPPIAGLTNPQAAQSSTVPESAVPARRPVVSPLAADRYEVRFTARAETREKLRMAQDLLRHAIPDGDPAEIIDRALTLLLEDLARKKFAATDRPRAESGSRAGSRHVPAKVKRAVWLRDRGHCAYVGTSGRGCRATAFLEFHHRDPYALGGEATVENIELRCRAHNAYEATLCFGSAPQRGEGAVKERGRAYGIGFGHGLVPERVAPDGPRAAVNHDAGRASLAGDERTAAAWVPLVVYVLVERVRGATGGNPIGLGLLAWLGTGLGLLLLLAGAIADSRRKR